MTAGSLDQAKTSVGVSTPFGINCSNAFYGRNAAHLQVEDGKKITHASKMSYNSLSDSKSSDNKRKTSKEEEEFENEEIGYFAIRQKV